MHLFSRLAILASVFAASASAETKLNLGKQSASAPLEPLIVTVPIGEKLTINFPVLSGNLWLKDNAPVLNAAGRTLVIDSVTPFDAGTYRVLYTANQPSDSQELILRIATSVTSMAENPRFLTLTTRGIAGTGNQALVSGFAVGEVLGNPVAQKTVLVRAVGPTLTEFGVAGALADPILAVHDQKGETCTSQASSLEELETAQKRAGAFPLNPGAKDAVQLLRLPAGAFTAQVTSADGSVGVVLLEIYEVPDR